MIPQVPDPVVPQEGRSFGIIRLHCLQEVELWGWSIERWKAVDLEHVGVRKAPGADTTINLIRDTL